VSRLRTAADLRAALPALFQPIAGERAIGLAVSGGADSLALMLLAREWAATLSQPPAIFVYSVDHGLRAEAVDEVAFVLREAARLGLTARGLRWDGPKPTAGTQAAARAARYRLIGNAMRADGVNVLLTAHHQDDQAETVMMRLAHGSGLEGLRGMDAMSDVHGVRVFRPLLGVPRALLGAVVSEAGLAPVSDLSNADPHYERVRWRQAMLLLAGLGLDASRIAQLARRAGDADEALSQLAEPRLAGLVSVDPFGAARLSVSGLAALPRAIGVKLLSRVVDRVGGDRRQHALGVVERLYERLLARERTAFTMAGITVRPRYYDIVWLAREPGRAAIEPAQVRPFEIVIWDQRFRIANRTGDPLRVHMADDLTRRSAEKLVGHWIATPAAAIRTAPLVLSADGTPLALGCHRLAEGVAIEFLWGRGNIAANVTSN